MGEVDRATLESRRRFYEEVYKPGRDELSDSWTQKYLPGFEETLTFRFSESAYHS